jgi:hypothetical protein
VVYVPQQFPSSITTINIHKQTHTYIYQSIYHSLSPFYIYQAVKMVAIARLLLLASTVAAATIQLLPRDITTVINDLKNEIAPKLETLNIHINSFPQSGRPGAEIIIKDATALIQAINTATTHVKESRNFDLAAGARLLTELQPRLPLVLSILTNIRAKAASWDAIEGPKLAQDDLKAGEKAFSDYLDAVIAAEPEIQRGPVVTAKGQLVKAFDETIKAYS